MIIEHYVNGKRLEDMDLLDYIITTQEIQGFKIDTTIKFNGNDIIAEFGLVVDKYYHKFRFINPFVS